VGGAVCCRSGNAAERRATTEVRLVLIHETIPRAMTVTPNSDAAPWDRPPTDPNAPFGQPPAGSGPPLEPVRRRGLNLRWIAAIVAALAVVAVVVVVLALSSPQPAAGLARIAPANSMAYIELRMDLPGDQRDRLAAFLQKFPGFDDPATFETKILDTFDSLLGQSTQGLYSWRDDIDPWFGGQVAFFFSGEGDLSEPNVVVALSVKDRTAAQSFIDRLNIFGASTGHYYKDVPIHTPPFGTGSLAVTDDALLLGLNTASIESVIDVQAGDAATLAEEERFSAATAGVSADRLALIYLDNEKLRPWLEQLMQAAAFMMPSVPLQGQLAALNGTSVLELRVEDDRLALTARGQPAPGASHPPFFVNRDAGLAEMAPADTLLYAETREFGQTFKQTIDQMLATLGSSEPDLDLTQIETFLGTPLDDFLDFVGDTSFSLSATGDRYSGGFIARVTDESVAVQRLERLATAVRAAALMGSVPVEVEEQTHGDARITVLRLENVAGEELPGIDLPAELPISSISYTITNGMLLLGVDGFVVDALSQGSDSSLAAEPGFRQARDAAGGAENAGVVYLNIGAARGQLEGIIPPPVRGQYENEVKPYIEPFSRLIGVYSLQGDEQVTRYILYVE
jgi:hypothetical protein